MRRKKGSFLTFCFSLMPGAGHMYMGFMKTGVSLMSLFFAIIFISSWLGIGSVLYLLPVLWFYAFFDSLNRHGASDEAFAAMEDRYLFSLDQLAGKKDLLAGKRNLWLGIALVLFGSYILLTRLLSRLWYSDLIPEYVYDAFNAILHSAPQMLVGLLIILLGIKLISNKKREGGTDA